MDITEYTFLLPTLSFVVNIFLFSFVISRKSKSQINLVFLALEGALILWSFGTILLFKAPNDLFASLGDRIETFGTILTAAFIFHLFALFTRQKFPRKMVHFLFLYFPGFVLMILYAIPGLIPVGVEEVSWGYMSKETSTLFYFLVGYTLVFTMAGLVLGMKYYYETKSEQEKNKSRLLIIAITIPLIFGTLTQLILPLMGIESIPPLTSSFTTVTAIIIAYAISRYKLLELLPSETARTILDNIMDYLVVVDHENKISLVRQSLLTALGMKEVDIIGEEICNIFIEGDKYKELCDRVKERGEVKDYEISLKDSRATGFSVSVNISQVIDEFGNKLGYILVMRDISETKKLLDKLNEKTKEIESSKLQLEAKNKELEEINHFLLDREKKMIELKEELKKLKNK